MNSPHSGSDRTATGGAPPSTAYELYHPAVQRWIYDSGWNRLRDVQERAAARILARRQDVIIAAATASGKTEAAWLPICSALISEREAGAYGPGIKALAISPLKALINDQYDRITQLCDRLDIPVHRWHGDVPAARKSRLVHAPDGILLITPESLEALFVNHGSRVRRVLGGRPGWTDPAGGGGKVAAHLEPDLTGVLVGGDNDHLRALARAEELRGRGEVAQGCGERDPGYPPADA